MKKILFIFTITLVFCLIFVNCKNPIVEEEFTENKIPIKNIIAFAPDRFNTGCDESLISKITTGNYGEILTYGTDSENPTNVYIEVRDGEKYNDIVINAYANKSLADVIKIKNLEFTKKLMPVNSDKEGLYISNKTIIFENCKFQNVQHDSEKLKLIFRNCTFNGNIARGNIELENCRIEKTLKDAMNPLRNFKANKVYVRNLIHKVSTSGAHVDGVQIFGYKDVLAQNIIIENSRFSIPCFQYEGAKTNVNAALMMQLEFGNADGVTFQNIIIDCGSPWSGPCRSTKPKLLDDGTQLYQKNVYFKDIKISPHYPNCFHGDYYKDIIEENITHPNYLYVTSVIQDVNGVTHVIVTNNTAQDKTLVVKSKNQSWEFMIPKMPAPKPLFKDESYKNLRYQDMPFDVDCKIPVLLENGTCYDGETELISFDFND